MTRSFVFLDIETTGLSPEEDDIIEIGAIIASDGQIINKFNSLIKARKPLPLRIINLTGINDRQLADAPDFSCIEDDFHEFLADFPIAGYNVNFDLSFLNKKMNYKIKNQVIDVMELVQFMMPSLANYRLETVAATLKIGAVSFHRALDDAEITGRIFFECLKQLEIYNHEVLLNIYRLVKYKEENLFKVLAHKIKSLFKKFPESSVQPFSIFSKSANQDSGTLFEEKEKKREEPIIVNFESLMSSDGPIACNINNYTFRQEQLEMLLTVQTGFCDSKHIVIEAGTGTGKSLAYLLPAIVWATSEKQKVVVSTHTINLQEQLWYKDLPIIKDATGLIFDSALVKGRNNYLCLRRWQAKMNECQLMDRQETEFYLKTLIWLTHTETGDKSEINLNFNQARSWNEVGSEQDTCFGVACSFFHRGCYVIRAKKKAEMADIVVTNHSLLMADLRLNNILLPNYEYLIIDEAHHLEKSATEQLGWSVELSSIRYLLITLNRKFGDGSSPGLLNQLRHILKNSKHYLEEDCIKIDSFINDAHERISLINDAIIEIESFLKQFIMCKTNNDCVDEQLQVLRLRDEYRAEETWSIFKTTKENLLNRISSLSTALNRINSKIESMEGESQKKLLSVAKDFESMIGKFSDLATNLNSLFSESNEYVYWVEIEKGIRNDIRIKGAPISVSQLLFDGLLNKKKSVIMTSATITVNGRFEHFIERIGLEAFEKDKVITKNYESPFDYSQQSLLCAVRDLPDPGLADELDYIDGISPIITDISKVFNGKTLVLFTSHKMLKAVYGKIKHSLSLEGIDLLGHGIDGGRTRLTNEFKRGGKKVLLGASSFWEGVDLPGDELKCVIIVRLPFTPPNIPIVEARIEELTRKNKDAFKNYSLPEAVIKFRQGFGRLIRSEIDEGIVVVLDRRIVEKRYGRYFLNSLPVKFHYKGDSASVLLKITDWHQGERPIGSYINIQYNMGKLENYIRQIGNKDKH
jgi:ATP-dependent DNA helicase DinG